MENSEKLKNLQRAQALSDQLRMLEERLQLLEKRRQEIEYAKLELKKMKEKGEVDDEYFNRLEVVIDWMEANPKTMREIGEKFFSKCPNCDAELIPGSIEVKEDGKYRIVICKKCKKEIAKYYMPRKFF